MIRKLRIIFYALFTQTPVFRVVFEGNRPSNLMGKKLAYEMVHKFNIPMKLDTTIDITMIRKAHKQRIKASIARPLKKV